MPKLKTQKHKTNHIYIQKAKKQKHTKKQNTKKTKVKQITTTKKR